MDNYHLNPRKIYLIGGNSYIAGQVRNHFTKIGHTVIGINHSSTFSTQLEDEACIINCSASYQPEDDWEQMLSANFLFAKNLIERSNNTHTLINLASYFELGDISNPGPVNYYATAKLLLRAWLTDLGYSRGSQVVNLLLYDVVGPNDQREKLIPHILRLKAGAEINLTGCEQVVTFVPIENIIEAISKVVQNRSISGLFTASSSNFVPLKDYILMLKSIIEFTPVFDAVPYQPTQIFEPVRNLPPLISQPLCSFNKDYIYALRKGSRSD